VIVATCGLERGLAAPTPWHFEGVCDVSEECEQAEECKDFQEAYSSYEGAEHENSSHAWRDPVVSCYHPVKGFRTPNGVVFSELKRHGDIIGTIELACGQCIGCRMRRASDWTLRCMHEASLWDDNCFITLTYARDCLPPNGSLCHADYQRFMKRLRKKKGKVRFYMCGEYGPLNGRPHYHGCLFGVDFKDRVPRGTSNSGELFYSSAELEELWTHGNVSVQNLTNETAGYCARYIMKKALGENAKTAYTRVDEDGVIIELTPEYAAMSLKPGIGAAWFNEYMRDVFPHDHVVQNGVERTPPKYYDRLYKKTNDAKIDDVEFARQKRAISARPENTDERLGVREKVHEAKVRSLRRDL